LTVRNLLLHDKADIALGFLEIPPGKKGGKLFEPKGLYLSLVIPGEGEEVSTCAYSDNPNSPHTYDKLKLGPLIKRAFGVVRKYYPEGRDAYLLPGPCVETSMTLKAGLSGGPVFNKNGYIIGVNSTSFTGLEKDISYFTPISPILTLPFAIEEEGKLINTTLLDMAKKAHFTIKPG